MTGGFPVAPLSATSTLTASCAGATAGDAGSALSSSSRQTSNACVMTPGLAWYLRAGLSLAASDDDGACVKKRNTRSPGVSRPDVDVDEDGDVVGI